jgi:SAM-dependent methyltransferase
VGFLPVGIDPSLEGVLAARRVAKQLEAEAEFLVGDGRRLPFADESFDVVFSYSVLQHFDKGEAGKVLGEIHRVLKPGGTSLVQMLNLYGLRSQYHLFRRGFRAPTGFEVRYWTPRKLKETFESLIGPTRCIVDGFFSANAQRSDVDMLSFPHRCVVYVSELLRALSRRLFPLRFLADSLYLESRKGDGGSHGTVVGRCGDEQARKTGNDFSGGGTAS